MNVEDKLEKFSKALKSCSNDQLLEHRDYALSQLDRLPAGLARKTNMYKALQILETEMVGRGL